MTAYPDHMTIAPQVQAFFDPATNTISYIVKDPASTACAIVDSVMDIDYAAGRITYDHADAMIAEIEAQGLALEWIIEDPQDHDADAQGDGAQTEKNWNTTLRLTLPRLGSVEAQLHLTPAGVALRLRTDDTATMSALDARAAELASALEAANLKLTGLVVERQHD